MDSDRRQSDIPKSASLILEMVSSVSLKFDVRFDVTVRLRSMSFMASPGDTQRVLSVSMSWGAAITCEAAHEEVRSGRLD